MPEKEDILEHELNGADSRPVMSRGNYFKRTLKTRPGWSTSAARTLDFDP